MRASTQKLTTAAVSTALAVILCAMTAYLPLSVMPLYFAAFCIFLAVKRGNIVYGVLCAVATVGIMFAFVGLSVKWLFLLFMFAPYGIITSFIQSFTYFKPKTGVLRGLFAVLYFNITFGLVYLIATRVASVGLDVHITEWVGRLGGYWLLALIATVILVPLDFIFSATSGAILKKIPAPVDRSKHMRGDKSEFYAQADKPVADEEKKYDIFGYEIKDSEQDGGKQSDSPPEKDDKPDGDDIPPAS